MDTRLITDSFLCPDSNWLLERTVLVIATSVCLERLEMLLDTLRYGH